MTGLYSESNNGDDGSIDTSHEGVEEPLQETLVRDQKVSHQRMSTVMTTDAVVTTASSIIPLSCTTSLMATSAVSVGNSATGGQTYTASSASGSNARVTSNAGESVTLNNHGNYTHNASNLRVLNDTNMDELLLISQDCGLLSCRPQALQRFARIKIFVLLLSILVTLQQALSSGYINSVITTIEKRFEIPSSFSGLIASSYEIGNVITVIFVSYLGSRRHIPVWIGIGKYILHFTLMWL